MLVLPVFPQDETPPSAGDVDIYSLSVDELRKRAEQGHADAQYHLGIHYSSGVMDLRDYEEAIRWYRAAAEQGYSKAQNNLGFMYDKGQGVPQDYIQAHMWFNLAAASGGDGEDREKAVHNRDEIAEKMTSEQIAEA